MTTIVREMTASQVVKHFNTHTTLDITPDTVLKITGLSLFIPKAHAWASQKDGKEVTSSVERFKRFVVCSLSQVCVILGKSIEIEMVYGSTIGFVSGEDHFEIATTKPITLRSV